MVSIYRWLSQLNSLLLVTGRQLAWVALALMTIIILFQVFYRYVLDSALPWPEEAARALMIWMTALAAPTAYRYGGFVSIEMLKDYLPAVLRTVLSIVLLIIAGIVLIKLFELALNFFQRGFRNYTASLYWPWNHTEKIRSAWVYLSMPVCFGLMLLINIELLLRELAVLFKREQDFPAPTQPQDLIQKET